MSIEKRNHGYTVRWRDSTGQQRSQQVRLWKDAVRIDGEIKRQKAMGGLLVAEKGQTTLREFWPTFWEQYALGHVSARTAASYEQTFNKHLDFKLGKLKLAEISADHISGYTAWQRDRGMAPSSVRRHLAVLQCILQRAVEWKYIASNPAAGIRKPALVGQRRGVAIDSYTLSVITESVDARSSAIIRLLAHSGLRPGEMRALTWVDVRQDAIIVDKAITGDKIAPTKTHANRQVELRPGAKQALGDLLALVPSPGPRDYVVPAVGSTQVWTDTAYRQWTKRVFVPAAMKANFRGERLRPYDLRHTFVSELISEGRDIYWIARQAGHSPEMALRTYAHLLKSVRQECAEVKYFIDGK